MDEKTHLELVADTSEVCQEEDIDYAMEHPHYAESWKTKTMERMMLFATDVELVWPILREKVNGEDLFARERESAQAVKPFLKLFV